jgi:isopenicillin N synthase-like dioxygenase
MSACQQVVVPNENVHPNLRLASAPAAKEMTTRREFESYVKVVDMAAPDAAIKFTDSLKKTGFAVVTNHGIDYSLVDKIYDEWRGFFVSGSADKDIYLRNKETQDGYFNIQEAESAKGVEVKDLKQYYQLYFPHGRYPTEVSKAAQQLFEAMIFLGMKLLTWIDQNMSTVVRESVTENLKKCCIDKIADTIDPTQTMLRILRYPPLPEIEEKLSSKLEEVRPGAVRAAAHEDINLITLLPAGSSAGLEVKKSEHIIMLTKLAQNYIVVEMCQHCIFFS